jgi:FtsZ-binding cell division protein ZapB
MSSEFSRPYVLNKVDELNSLLDRLKIAYENELTKWSINLDHTVKDKDNTIALLSKEIEGLKEINAYLLKDKDTLEKQVKDLEEEYRNFTKVSKIIALENENAKLKLELSKLTNTLTQTKKESKEVQTSAIPVSAPVVPPVAQTTVPSVSQSLSSDVETVEGNEEESIDVEEIIIEEKEYYIDDTKRVYLKLDDGSIGEELGMLGRKKGKYIIKLTN